MTAPLELRPYQMLCLICAQGCKLEGPLAPRVDEAACLIRDYPDRPVMLRAVANDVYAYQDPALGSEGSPEFNRKRDLDVLAALDLPPGVVLPARTLLYRVMKAIPSVRGLCGDEASVGSVWSGCPRAECGHYEAGLKLGIDSLIPPRDAEEMAREKRASVAAMESGQPLRIRPHVIMCAVCNFGQNAGQSKPLAEDNIVEFVDILRRHPDTAVVLAPGADWMICAPCPRRVPALNACVNVAGSGGLSNEKRDLDLLKMLGLAYETALPAREMLALLFSRVPDTSPVCRREQHPLSVWWDGCGEANCTRGNPGYATGRERLCHELELGI